MAGTLVCRGLFYGGMYGTIQNPCCFRKRQGVCHIPVQPMRPLLPPHRGLRYGRKLGCLPNGKTPSRAALRVSSTDDVLLQYCEPTPLTDEGYPIYTLKTVGAEASCVFLQGNYCSIYAARPRTCRLYPFSAGPGERGRILNTASVLMITSSITSTAEGTCQRLAVPQLSPGR